MIARRFSGNSKDSQRSSTDGRVEAERGARILVVDDEPNIVDVITMALRYQGFEVESAADGRGGARGRRELPART